MPGCPWQWSEFRPKMTRRHSISAAVQSGGDGYEPGSRRPVTREAPASPASRPRARLRIRMRQRPPTRSASQDRLLHLGDHVVLAVLLEFELDILAVALRVQAQPSLTTVAGSLSSRSPTNDACRTWPFGVISAYSTSATMTGLTQCSLPAARRDQRPGFPGPAAKGQSFCSRAASFLRSCIASRPVPTLPTGISASSS